MEKKTIWLVEDGIATMPYATKSGATDYFMQLMSEFKDYGADVTDMKTHSDGSITTLVTPKVGRTFVVLCYPTTLHE